jgi:anti-sigma factor RsiW
MTMHVDSDRLQDYVDGRLAGEARAQVERHVTRCEHCATEVAQLEALIGDLAGLRTGVTPNRDLLQGIHARIDARNHRWSLVVRAAAAVVLVVTSSAITALVMRTRQGPDVATALTHAEAAAFVRAHADYARAADELESLLREQRAELPPGTVEMLEHSLAVIDAALVEAQQALDVDPGNPMLSQMVLAGYEKKIDVLRRATTFPSL